MEEKKINRNVLFAGSCFALITTAFTFSIRAGILTQLGEQFNLTAEQLGFINLMWFTGFPISMILGGFVYHSFGAKNIMRVAFVAHSLGIIFTIYSSGYALLLASTLFIGFGNGCTEAACNPMIADSYSGVKLNKMLARFHMWFPGGIVIGSLISKFMTDNGFTWQAQMWVTMIPTIIYMILFYGRTFPKSKIEGVTSLSKNLRAMLKPTYIFIFCCMALTAITEFGPQQWVGLIMSNSGASPMLILALVTGLMAIGRFFAGPVVKTFGQTGVLLMSSIFAAIGIYLLSIVSGPIAYAAAAIFALGVCYFWPTMIGTVAQRAPLTGALGMSIVGAVGMLSSAIFQPIIGRWIDSARSTYAAAGLTGNELELAAGQSTLAKMVTFPAILIVLFTIFFIWQKKVQKAESKVSLA